MPRARDVIADTKLSEIFHCVLLSPGRGLRHVIRRPFVDASLAWLDPFGAPTRAGHRCLPIHVLSDQPGPGPSKVGDLRLDIARVSQKVAQPEEKLGLHAANEIGDLLIGSAQASKLLESVTHTGVWLVGWLSADVIERSIHDEFSSSTTIRHACRRKRNRAS